VTWIAIDTIYCTLPLNSEIKVKARRRHVPAHFFSKIRLPSAVAVYHSQYVILRGIIFWVFFLLFSVVLDKKVGLTGRDQKTISDLLFSMPNSPGKLIKINTTAYYAFSSLSN
jgi:hypothetical protein